MPRRAGRHVPAHRRRRTCASRRSPRTAASAPTRSSTRARGPSRRAPTRITFVHTLADAQRLRLRLSQDAAPDGDTLVLEHALQQHRPQAHRDQRLQPQLLHARPQDDGPGGQRPLPVRRRRRRAARPTRRRSTDATLASRASSAQGENVFTEFAGLRRRPPPTTTSGSSTPRRGAGVRIRGRPPADQAGLLVGAAEPSARSRTRRERRPGPDVDLDDHVRLL